MRMPKPCFRPLYEQMLNYQGERSYQDVLLPGLDEAHRTMDSLKGYDKIRARHLPDEDIIEHLGSCMHSLGSVTFCCHPFRRVTMTPVYVSRRIFL